MIHLFFRDTVIDKFSLISVDAGVGVDLTMVRTVRAVCTVRAVRTVRAVCTERAVCTVWLYALCAFYVHSPIRTFVHKSV